MVKQLSLLTGKSEKEPKSNGLLYDFQSDAIQPGESIVIYEDGTRETIKAKATRPARTKKSAKEPEENASSRDTWQGNIFFTAGYGFGLNEKLETVCLGKETSVKEALKTGAKSGGPAIDEIIESERMEENNAGNSTITVQSSSKFRAIKARNLRTRPAKGAQHRAKYFKRSKV